MLLRRYHEVKEKPKEESKEVAEKPKAAAKKTVKKDGEA